MGEGWVGVIVTVQTGAIGNSSARQHEYEDLAMPWRETCTMDEQMGLVWAYLAGEESIAAPSPPPEPSPIKGEGLLNVGRP